MDKDDWIAALLAKMRIGLGGDFVFFMFCNGSKGDSGKKWGIGVGDGCGNVNLSLSFKILHA